MSLINAKIVEQVNDHGWVPIDVLLRCNAIKRITRNKAIIAAALEDSDIVDVSDDGEKIRRNPEIPLPDNMPQYWQDLKKRTVFVRGFPHDTSNDEIMQFVNSYGEVVNVITQKHKWSRDFRGGVFVTFKDAATAQNFIYNPDTNRFRQAQLVRKMVNECNEKIYSTVAE